MINKQINLQLIIKSTPFLFFLALILLNLNALIAQDRTLDELAKELKSEEEVIRQKAAMVLEKYQEPLATNLLLEHIRDKSHLVRRAVLVSLQEKIQRRMIGIDSLLPIAELFNDTDVEVRRLATSSALHFLPQLLDPNLRHQNNFYFKNIDDYDKLKNNFFRATKDSDNIVRLNTLNILISNQRLLLVQEYKSIIELFLNDENNQVLITAISACQVAPIASLSAKLEHILENPSADVQKALINLLRSRQIKESRFFTKLLKNNSADVKMETLKLSAFFRLKEYYPQYQEFLNDNLNPIANRKELIYHLPSLPNGLQILLQLINNESIEISTEAIKVYSYTNAPNVLEELEKLLDNPSETIKEVSATAILTVLRQPNLTLIKKIFEKCNHRVQLEVLKYLSQHQLTEEGIIMEGLMSDNETTRIETISYAAACKNLSDQIKNMLIRTIEDPNEKIRTKAVQIIPQVLGRIEYLQLLEKNYPKLNDQEKIAMAIQLRSYPEAESFTLLESLLKEPNQKIQFEALISLWYKGRLDLLPKLASFLTNDTLQKNELIHLILVLSKKPQDASPYFLKVLDNKNEDVRFEILKFYNTNADLYTTSHYEKSLTETSSNNIQIANQICIRNKFKSKELLTKQIDHNNPLFWYAAFTIIKLNYNTEDEWAIKSLLHKNDARIKYWCFNLITEKNIKNTDQDIIDTVKNEKDEIIIQAAMMALLKLDTEVSKNYIKNIDENSTLYPILLKAKNLLETQGRRIRK